MDPFTVIMLAVLALLIFFMFRNGRKRQRDLQELQEKMVPGAEVMTSFGLYGTLVSVDEESNTVLVETSPGATVKLHRQALSRVVDPITADTAEDATVLDETAGPGVRVTETDGLRPDTGTPGAAPKRIDE